RSGATRVEVERGCDERVRAGAPRQRPKRHRCVPKVPRLIDALDRRPPGLDQAKLRTGGKGEPSTIRRPYRREDVLPERRDNSQRTRARVRGDEIERAAWS